MNGIFRGKAYGAVTVGERGQLVIPAELRKELKIKSGSKLMVFAKPDKKIISLMREEDFSHFLRKAAQMISRFEGEVSKKG
jgi:AbrB family looped-hinge helix DNA binding protein